MGVPSILQNYTYIYMGWGKYGFNSWGIRGPALVLFSFDVNVSGMCPQSRLSSHPLMIPAPWVLLPIRWSFPLVPPWVTTSRAQGGWAKTYHFFFTSTFLCFAVFPLLLTPNDIIPLNAACWGYSLIMYICLLNNHLLPPLRGQHTSCHEMSYSKRET